MGVGCELNFILFIVFIIIISVLMYAVWLCVRYVWCAWGWCAHDACMNSRARKCDTTIYNTIYKYTLIIICIVLIYTFDTAPEFDNERLRGSALLVETLCEGGLLCIAPGPKRLKLSANRNTNKYYYLNELLFCSIPIKLNRSSSDCERESGWRGGATSLSKCVKCIF